MDGDFRYLPPASGSMDRTPTLTTIMITPYYAYDDSYYDDNGCYIVQRRVLTRYGGHFRPVQVCG